MSEKQTESVLLPNGTIWIAPISKPVYLPCQSPDRTQELLSQFLDKLIERAEQYGKSDL